MSTAILLAPLSTDPIKDWPMAHYVALARLCVDRLDATVSFIGVGTQRQAVARAVRDLPAERFVNRCGQTSWAALARLVAECGGVAANNSGVAHLAAGLGAPTVCLYSGTHNPYAWLARGPFVSVLYTRTGCSPCGIERLVECPHGHRCMTALSPELAFAALQRMMAARAV